MYRNSDLETGHSTAIHRTLAAGPPRASLHEMQLGDLARGVAVISANRNAPVDRRTILHLQRHIGNRAVQRFLRVRRNAATEETVDPSVEKGIASASGLALDQTIRPQMEEAFGADFSGVRIHTGAHADAMNRQVSAVAFTTGSNIFFSDGAYNSGTTEGKRLLAHELTHVVQQQGGIATKLTLGQPGDIYEQEANRAADAVVERLAAGPGTLSRECPACGEDSNRPGIQHKCSECESKERTAGDTIRTAVIRRKVLRPPSLEVRHFGSGMLNRQGNPWFECRAQGVPCPPGSWFNDQMCRMIGCYRAKTSTLPFAVSPGVCIFRCPDGSLCTCVLVGTSTEAVCTFRFCDSAAKADTQDDIDNLAMAALDAYQQQAPAQQDPEQGPSQDPSQTAPQQPEEANA